jgi:hypothetical protein
VPANLEPGDYDIVIKTAEGQSAAAEGVKFTVRGARNEVHAAIESALSAMAVSGDASGEQRVSLLKALRTLDTSAAITPAMKQEALRETAELLSSDGSIVTAAQLPAVNRILSELPAADAKDDPGSSD